ncbi:MAG: acyl-CoA desaturase [Salibacteraceae bacterium]|nr:acyl-CoA desaturase [Salibacteraceae bacterium]
MQFTSYRFDRQSNAEFYKTLRKRVNDYFSDNNISRTANAAMVIKTISLIVLYLAPFVLMLTAQVTAWVPFLGLWLLMGLGAAGIGFSVMHDANHGAYSTSKTINRILGNLMNILGANSSIWKLQHNVLHHSFTNIDGADEDIDAPSFLRFSPHQAAKPIHKYQHIYAWPLYGFMILLKVLYTDFTQAFHYRKIKLLTSRKEFTTLLAKISFWKVIYFGTFVVLPMAVLPVPFWQVLVGFLVMHYVVGLAMAVIFQSAHVMPETAFPAAPLSGKMDNNWAVHQMMTTTNFAPNNKILSWYVGGLNFQVEHHLFPSICHIHYQDISKIVKATAEEYGIPYHQIKSFRATIAEHAKMLYLLGNDKIAAPAAI